MEQTGTVRYWSAPTPPELCPAETVKDPDLQATLDYWLKLKGARRMPARTEISPRDIKRSLRTVHIYDIVAGGADFRARLVGTGVFPGLDDDQTGKLLSDHPDPGIRLRFMVALKHVASTGEPVRSLSLRKTGDLLTDAHTEGLWLPLGEADHVEQVLAQSSLRTILPDSSDFAGKADGSEAPDEP
jgi:hypothetical protein